MDKFIHKAPSCSPQQAAELTNSILNMIVTDMRPLSMVEDDGFRAMISTFHPKYELPSRTFFTKQMEKKYELIKARMKQALQDTDSIALTTDIWTSISTRAMALAAKQRVRQPTANKHETDSTAQDSPPAAHATRTTSFLDSDSTISDEEEDEEQQLNQALNQEVFMYFGEHPLPKKENPLTWWEKNAARYPTLAELARSLLCIPATSTPSERLFSAAGNIVSEKRASLSPEHVDMLTFLHCNKVLL